MEAAFTELRKIRENNLRVSSRVIELWTSQIEGNLQRLGSEKWTLLEQVFIAALDVSNHEIAQSCLEQLRARFPRSTRVNRLYGMYLESSDKFDEARALYSQIIETEPTNQVARKRLIAILKAKGQVTEAIEELNRYLKTFMADSEAWSELADLHLAQGNYKHAAFCVEDMILANPHNHLLHQRLAEIKYTEGGAENMELAKSYFAHACRLNPNNTRALYGLLLASSNLSGKTPLNQAVFCDQKEYFSLPDDQIETGTGGGQGRDKREYQRLSVWASNRIAELYEEANLNVPFSQGVAVPLKNSSSHKHLGLRQRETAACKELCAKLETLSTEKKSQ